MKKTKKKTTKTKKYWKKECRKKRIKSILIQKTQVQKHIEVQEVDQDSLEGCLKSRKKKVEEKLREGILKLQECNSIINLVKGISLVI